MTTEQKPVSEKVREGKRQRVLTEVLKLKEQGFLDDLPTFEEEGTEIDLNERFEPLNKALEALTTPSKENL